MRNLKVKYDEPWSMLSHMKDEINSLFRNEAEGINLPVFMQNENWPDVDIEEQDKCYIVTANVPGMAAEDISITFGDGILTLEGEVKTEHQETKKNYLCSERSSGSFYRRFTLDSVDDSVDIDAKYDKGVLTITLQKSEDTQNKRRKIEIKSS